MTAEAIATATPATATYGLVGLNSISMSGNGETDSYNSANGAYSHGSAGSNGSVASNGNITLSGNADVNGDARPGIGKSVSHSGNASVSGSMAALTSTLSYAAASAGSYATVNDNGTIPSQFKNNGDFGMSGNNTLNLSAGNYYFDDFSLAGNATLNITGAVTLYVTGNVSLSGNMSISQNLPSNFKIRNVSTGSITISGNGSLYADVYSPQGSVSLSGNGDFYGALVGKTLTISGNGGVHYDTALGGQNGGSAGTISMVK